MATPSIRLIKNSRAAHLLAFGMMVVAAIFMYLFAQKGLTIGIWGALILYVLGNLVELAIR